MVPAFAGALRLPLLPTVAMIATASALWYGVITYVAFQVGADWPRLKACRADDCHWAFFDEARNRSRAWCDMKVCGNRQKVHRYRARHAA